MKKIFLLASILLFIQCINAQESDAYKHTIESWHQKRIEDLKKTNGWLNLEGLFWLNSGVNQFGKSKESDCRFEESTFPDHLGDFIFNGDSVVWVNKIQKGALVNDKTIAINEPITVFKTSNGNYTSANFSWGSYRWVIIKREDKVGIRFRNLNAKTLKEFKGIERFPVDSKWKLKAKLIQPVQGLLMITNVLGQTTAQKNAGQLIFEMNGKDYSLDVIDEGGPKYFITFADETSNKTTYGAGRFIEIAKPDADGNTEIDFNLAYNPPCAFTAFATCPLPPPQNRLAIAITAGEKKYGHH